MQIALDISQVAYEGTGVARFTAGLVDAICSFDDRHHWTFLFSSLRRPLPSSLRERIAERKYSLLTYPLPPRLLSVLWNDLGVLKTEALVGSQDWFISSDWTQPPSRARKATIVHDLIFRVHPETVTDLIRTTQEKRLKRAVRECAVLFTDSRSTKDDLLRLYPVSDTSVVVNYPGFTSLPQPDSVQNSERPFILTVGKREPRKNLDTLITAFRNLQRTDIDLVIIGMDGWGDRLSSLPNNVHLRGFVNDQELARLYATCTLFVFPSIYEGFGYPALEAMSLGAPTALANTSSLAEIGAGTSVLFDPHDTAGITTVLETLLSDRELRSDLSKKGKKRVKTFTWERYLKTMTDELEKRI